VLLPVVRERGHHLCSPRARTANGCSHHSSFVTSRTHVSMVCPWQRRTHCDHKTGSIVSLLQKKPPPPSCHQSLLFSLSLFLLFFFLTSTSLQRSLCYYLSHCGSAAGHWRQELSPGLLRTRIYTEKTPLLPSRIRLQVTLWRPPTPILIPIRYLVTTRAILPLRTSIHWQTQLLFPSPAAL
jgi:hypothetical protein